MRICVVTPYFNTPIAWLEQCHQSVCQQTLAAEHILVCDGCTPAPLENFLGTHIILRRNYADYGNTPRLIGCYRALAQDADAIAFLDGDNWFYPDHLAGLVAFAQAEGLEACASARMLHRLDGSAMLRCPVVNGTDLIDTNCLLVMRPAFPHLIAWTLYGQDIAATVDQAVWQFMRAANVRVGFLDRATVAYRTRHQVHYEMAQEMPPDGSVVRSNLHGEEYH